MMKRVCGTAAVITLVAGVSAFAKDKNSPPQATNWPSGYTLNADACVGELIDITPGFTGPEWGQVVTITYQDRNGAVGRGCVITVNNGMPATANIRWRPTCDDAGTYVISFTGSDNWCCPYGITTIDLTLNIVCPNPLRITQQPISQEVCPGATVNFSVTATSSGSITYQWRKNGVPIPGATSTSYAIDAVRIEDAGTYSCMFTNSCGTKSGTGATLTVDEPVTIIADPTAVISCPGTGATFTVGATGTPPLSYQWLKDGSPIAGATSATYSIASPVGADNGEYSVAVGNVCGSVISAAARLAVLVNPYFTDQPRSLNICSGGAMVLSARATGTEPLAYQWQKDGLNLPGQTGTTFTIDPVRTEDAGVYTIIAANGCGATTSNAAQLVVDTVPVITQQPAAQVICPDDPVTFSVVASAAGNSPFTYQWRKAGTPINGANGSSFTISHVHAADAADYSVVVGNACGSVVSENASLSVLVDTVITQQPVSQNACVGGAVSFEVSAIGTDPIGYQWQKNGLSIPGATGRTLTINPVGSSDVGTYKVRLNNQCNFLYSNNAALLVSAGATITQQPADQYVCMGDSASFSVGATGSPRPTYQWMRNHVAIAGATGTTLMINPVTSGDFGTYCCMVTSSCGPLQSRDAALQAAGATVNITHQPESTILCSGDPLTLNIAANGDPQPRFQWRKDGVSMPGVTGTTFSIPVTAETDTAVYDVEVSNGCASIISDAATVIVWSTGSADINGDGGVNGLDIRLFVETLLTHQTASSMAFCGSDMNANGAIGVDDVPPFIGRLLGR